MPLNIFETLPVVGGAELNQDENATGRALHFQCVEIYDSISWNNVAMVVSGGSSDVTYNILVGLYSLTGSTLTLVNQATNTWQSGYSWVSLVTSATSNITPGNWWLGWVYTRNSGRAISFWGNNSPPSFNDGEIEPDYIRGVFTANTAALPGSINRNEIGGEGRSSGGSQSSFQPYILISA